MKIDPRRVAKLVSTTAVIAAVMSVGGVAPAGAGGGAASLHGVFSETAAGSSLGYDVHGSAKMTIGPSGTVVRVNVSGLDPAKLYGSHLHNGACASGGGGHYQDVEGGAVVPPNELWLSSGGGGLVPNPRGVAHGWALRFGRRGSRPRRRTLGRSWSMSPALGPGSRAPT